MTTGFSTYERPDVMSEDIVDEPLNSKTTNTPQRLRLKKSGHDKTTQRQIQRHVL